jgi:hypothetical protein|uniref:Uncharacterized protein n=1 Tax=CrAss-like virus sp. ctt4r3 TaxID=2823619 RepID=A0A8S5L7B8_9CAUD|nr:MAG TPA: hypothetical protein [CrAss-like virus sp. ctt4r3]
MNESRHESEKKNLNELLDEINSKHGLTNGNSYVAREMVRIYNKMFKREIILAVKKEAALRVLHGQADRGNPFIGIDFITNVGNVKQENNYNN